MGDASTRVYEDGSWAWKPEVGEDSPYATDVDKIGLCWTGVNNGSGYAGPASETGDMVYTNVKFNHVGWLYEGEENGPKLHCGVLDNGEFHDFDGGLNPQANWDGDASFFKASKSGKTLDFSKGVFRSGNGTIYEGEYIVYFPYNDSFWNAPVTAKQERLLDLTISENNTVVDAFELMSKHAFNVGYMEEIKGGKEACEFTTRILTSGIRFEISSEIEKEIREIVLWSKGEKAFLTSQALSAKEIKNALKSTGLSTNVYIKDSKVNDASSTMVVRTNMGGKNLKVTGSSKAEFYVPFLPNTIKDLNILLVDNNGNVAVLNEWKNISFKANKPNTLKLSINANGKVENKDNVVIGEFVDKNYAYDQASFEAAYAKAYGNASNEAAGPRTVVMLDDIELEGVPADANNKYNLVSTYPVIIESDPSLAEGEHNTLTLGGNANANVNYGVRSTTFDVNVETLAQGCCNKGMVNVVLAKSTKTNVGTTLTVNGGKLTLMENVVLEGDVLSLFESADEEGELHSDRVPEVKILAKADVTSTAKFVNEGRMTIESKETGKGVLKLNGAEFVNGTENTITNNKRASVTVEGIGETGGDAVINMSTNATLTNNGDIYNHGNIDNNSAANSFTNEANATFTDYVGSSLSGHRIVNKENAEFICEVNSVVRYDNAIDLGGIRPTTTVRFVYGKDKNIGSGTYTTDYVLTPQEGKDGIYVPYSEDKLVKFESSIDNTTNDKVNTLTLKHKTDTEGKAIATKIGDLTVDSGRITIDHEALTIDGDYTAKKGALNTNLTKGIAKITGDMNLSTTDLGNGSTGNVTLAAEKTLNIEGNLNAVDIASGLTFNANSNLNVGGDINIKKVATGTNFAMGTKVVAKNMTVDNGQTVKFDKNNVTYLGKKNENNGTLTNNGSIEIVNAVSGSDVAAKVWCNKRAGNGTYANNSYPQYY